MIYYSRIRDLDELIEREYGEIGSNSCSDYEEKAQMFIVREML